MNDLLFNASVIASLAVAIYLIISPDENNHAAILFLKNCARVSLTVALAYFVCSRPYP